MAEADGTILSSIGVEIIGVISPVSICMLLVVVLVSVLSPAADPPASRTAVNLVYLESPSDSAAHKLEGSLLNALVFVALLAALTFVLVLLYYYNFTALLKHYTRFSTFFVLGGLGGPIFLALIDRFSVPVDSITCFVLLFNFAVIGAGSVFGGGVPIFVTQVYMVLVGIFVAAWFTKLPEWSTWITLVALAVYDLVAVLAPGGPLKMLVELASRRQEQIPALVYESRPPAVPRNAGGPAILGLSSFGSSQSSSVELPQLSRSNENGSEIGSGNGFNSRHAAVEAGNHQLGGGNSARVEWETSPLVSHSGGRPESSEIVVHEDISPPAENEMLGVGNERERIRRENAETSVEIGRGIKLGLGDFVFYSVLVGRAAMYDLMTVYACYLAIISGLGCTLILLSVCQRALPALPISIALGVTFYFLTRLLLEPFVIVISTNSMMF